MLWFSNSTEVIRNPLTLSLENVGEANFVFEVLKEWIDVLGGNEILLTSPYKSQVSFTTI